MKKKLKLIEKVIAAVLVVVVAAQLAVPAQTQAASTDIRYVSELIVSYGEGDAAEADAKQWLVDNGYTVIDTNLNAGAESAMGSNSVTSWVTGARSARAVYLGYKTTSDVNQAITSIHTMNMTGNYSYTSYQEVLDSMADDLSGFMKDLKVTLDEWRTNYKAGRGKAIEVYYLLNLMYEPDNNNAKLGDLLLNETKEEMGDDAYNKLSDVEKLQHLDMTTLLMQGNSNAMMYIEQLLAMGADTSTDTTWLKRLEASGSYDSMMDAMEEQAEADGATFSPSDAAADLASKYDSAATKLAIMITNIQKYFQEYKNSGVSLQDDTNAITSYLNKSDAEDGANWLNIGMMYEALAAYKYPSSDNPDRTLQDFFMESFDYNDANSRQLLYPMAQALSEGQRTALEFVTMTELITMGITTDEEALKSAETYKASIDAMDPISVFSGVDRSIYNSSQTALTSSARELQNSAQSSYTEGLFGSPFSLRTVISAGILACSLTATVACGIIASVCRTQGAPAIAANAVQQRIESYVAEQGLPEGSNIDLWVNMLNGDKGASKFAKGYESALTDYAKMSSDAKIASRAKAALIQGYQYATAVLVVVTIALGVWTVISGVKDLREYYNREMDLYPIPDNMVDESTDSSGNKVYTYYKAVQCNRTEKGLTKDREALKDNADLNGDLGKEWLALYYTKDKNAGRPLAVSDVADFKIVKGQESTPTLFEALTNFGSTSPVNLTNSDWVWNDPTGGLYLYYQIENASSWGSVFSDTNKWFIIAGAGVIIAAIFFFGGMAFGGRKRKNSKEDVPAEA